MALPASPTPVRLFGRRLHPHPFVIVHQLADERPPHRCDHVPRLRFLQEPQCGEARSANREDRPAWAPPKGARWPRGVVRGVVGILGAVPVKLGAVNQPSAPHPNHVGRLAAVVNADAVLPATAKRPLC
jgi:hypothetical protein